MSMELSHWSKSYMVANVAMTVYSNKYVSNVRAHTHQKQRQSYCKGVNPVFISKY